MHIAEAPAASWRCMGGGCSHNSYILDPLSRIPDSRQERQRTLRLRGGLRADTRRPRTPPFPTWFHMCALTAEAHSVFGFARARCIRPRWRHLAHMSARDQTIARPTRQAAAPRLSAGMTTAAQRISREIRSDRRSTSRILAARSRKPPSPPPPPPLPPPPPPPPPPTAEQLLRSPSSQLPPKLLNSLMPFQKEGVSFLVRHGGRALVADEMGLGKTLQVAALLNVTGLPAYLRRQSTCQIPIPSIPIPSQPSTRPCPPPHTWYGPDQG